MHLAWSCSCCARLLIDSSNICRDYHHQSLNASEICIIGNMCVDNKHLLYHVRLQVSTLEDAFCMLLVQCIFSVNAHALPICHSDASCLKIMSTSKTTAKLSEQCASCQYQPPNNVGPECLMVADSLHNFRCKRNLKVDFCVFHATLNVVVLIKIACTRHGG